jgi:deoxyribose-phosphate aldolase
VECVDDVCLKTCFDDYGQLISMGAERISSTLGSPPDNAALAKYIDHTLLKPESTAEQIAQLCQEAKTYHFGAVCVNAGYVKMCSDLLAGTGIKVASVIGFPLGATTTKVKVYETENAIKDGASELDMVINIGAVKGRNLELAAKDVMEVVKVAHASNAIVKVIIETALLTYEEKVLACLICKEARADFVKTSTGFSTAGATVEDIHLMSRIVGSQLGVKAAGGIRNLESLQQMIESGATRIGATVGVKIMKELEGNPQSATAQSGGGY